MIRLAALVLFAILYTTTAHAAARDRASGLNARELYELTLGADDRVWGMYVHGPVNTGAGNPGPKAGHRGERFQLSSHYRLSHDTTLQLVLSDTVDMLQAREGTPLFGNWLIVVSATMSQQVAEGRLATINSKRMGNMHFVGILVIQPRLPQR